MFLMSHAFDYRSLSVQERLELIGEIWDSIVDGDPDAVPVPPEHVAELDRRLDDEKLNPEPRQMAFPALMSNRPSVTESGIGMNAEMKARISSHLR